MNNQSRANGDRIMFMIPLRAQQNPGQNTKLGTDLTFSKNGVRPNQLSSQKLTGPSLMRATFMSAPNSPAWTSGSRDSQISTKRSK